MDSWREVLKGNPIPWLLEPDTAQPAIRYFTLRDVLGYREADGTHEEVTECLDFLF